MSGKPQWSQTSCLQSMTPSRGGLSFPLRHQPLNSSPCVALYNANFCVAGIRMSKSSILSNNVTAQRHFASSLVCSSFEIEMATIRDEHAFNFDTVSVRLSPLSLFINVHHDAGRQPLPEGAAQQYIRAEDLKASAPSPCARRRFEDAFQMSR
jgi:hypothetical protein